MTNSQIYSDWIISHSVDDVELPDRRGLFRKGQLLCILPFLRVYCKTENGLAPLWEESTWQPLGDGYTRFCKSDQALNWIQSLLEAEETSTYGERIRVELKRALRAWLVPVDAPLVWRSDILSRRVETIRVRIDKNRLNWSRRSDRFPDIVREGLAGLDVVHTPENDRAGLTRYLCDGWHIDGDGRLTAGETATSWGPVTSKVGERLHDAPRRLMLASSLVSRAVNTVNQESLSAPTTEESAIPGTRLTIRFSSLGGLTHEDAIVISKSAAAKLARDDVLELSIRIPAVASRVELLAESDMQVRQGDPLARAFIDLFALGYRRHEAELAGASDGWLEIAIPGAIANQDGQILKVTRRIIRSMRWRELITFHTRVTPPVSVGDKLATSHGIKGIVSRVIDALPAEIILSPVGVARRGAIGQFLEAGLTESTTSKPIFVIRQPQNATENWAVHTDSRSFVNGIERKFIRGQRVGEMEFWALMAHGAPNIANELLSTSRSTAHWIKSEQAIGPGTHQTLATRAVNRYLASINLNLDEGRIIRGTSVKAFDIPCETFSQLKQAWDLLEDEAAFIKAGGNGILTFVKPDRENVRPPWLSKPLTLEIEGQVISLSAVHIVPPWLRPPTQRGRHELTKAYRQLFLDFFMKRSIAESVERCVRIVIEHRDDWNRAEKSFIPSASGVMSFVRREVLGRRVNRSARGVIVPRPDIHVNQIAIPQFIAEAMFGGLRDQQRKVVLVNRNPTLHHRGLLALMPVIEDTSDPVFGLPLGILQVLGADFDGDQITVIALESDEAVIEAERLVPGCDQLRIDQFRPNHPAFPLLHELTAPVKELDLARNREMTTLEWCEAYSTLLHKQIDSDPDGWKTARAALEDKKNKQLWDGLSEEDWLRMAEKEMKHVYETVRKKGQFGGVLRRELYRRRHQNPQSFYNAVAALQTVTERVVQTALSVKTGEGLSSFNTNDFFDNPTSGTSKAALLSLDPTFDAEKLTETLGARQESTGILGWLGQLTAKKLLDAVVSDSDDESKMVVANDPRLKWYLS
jgi:RNA polymerase Rpb1, domain 2/RNA polymerase Rpb2, domain 6